MLLHLMLNQYTLLDFYYFFAQVAKMPLKRHYEQGPKTVVEKLKSGAIIKTVICFLET